MLVNERDDFAKAGPENEVIQNLIGTGLLTSDIIPYLIHWRADLWPGPQVDLDRFLGDRARERSPYAYIPSGMGARRCIGARLSTIEVAMALAALSRCFAVKWSDDASVRCMPSLTFWLDDRVRPRRKADGGA